MESELRKKALELIEKYITTENLKKAFICHRIFDERISQKIWRG